MNLSNIDAARAAMDVAVTRQTARNHVMRHAVVEIYEVPEERRRHEVVKVYLDEDHIALQRDKNGRKRAWIPIGAVFGGRYRKGRKENGRVRLLNPACFTDSELRAPGMAQTIAGYITGKSAREAHCVSCGRNALRCNECCLHA